MAKMLTDPIVRAATCPAGRDYLEIQDHILVGFGLRVSRSTGKRVWWCRVKDPATGKRTRQTIGIYPDTGLALAREIAREKILESRSGVAARRGMTIFELAKRFVERHLEPKRKPKTITEYKKILNGYVLPVWGELDIGDIDVRRTAELLDPIARRAPVMANRVRATLSSMWTFAMGQGLVNANPIRATLKPGAERKRQRWLEDAEIQAMMLHWDAERSPGAGALLVQLATGQRISEVLGMQHEQLTDDGWWNTPTKTIERHSVFVGGELVQGIIERMRTWWGPDGPVFRTMSPGRKGERLATIRRAVDRTRQATGITDWSSHVLRHTAETGMAAIKVPPHIRDMIFGHVGARGVGARYDHHAYRDEIREAMLAWGAKLRAIQHRRI